MPAINGGTKFFLTEPRTQPRNGNSALVTIGTTGSLAIMYVNELSFSRSETHELRDTPSPCHRSCEQKLKVDSKFIAYVYTTFDTVSTISKVVDHIMKIHHDDTLLIQFTARKRVDVTLQENVRCEKVPSCPKDKRIYLF